MSKKPRITVPVTLFQESWDWFFKVIYNQKEGFTPPRGEHSLGNFWTIVQKIEGDYQETLKLRETLQEKGLGLLEK